MRLMVLTFVFGLESQSVSITRLHQTSIGINWSVKLFFDNQRATIGQHQNIFRYPCSGAIKAKRLGSERPIQLGRHSEKGQNTIISWQVIRILVWSWKVPPIKRNELRIFGPLFFGSRAACNKSRGSGPPMGSQLGDKLTPSKSEFIVQRIVSCQTPLYF